MLQGKQVERREHVGYLAGWQAGWLTTYRERERERCTEITQRGKEGTRGNCRFLCSMGSREGKMKRKCTKGVAKSREEETGKEAERAYRKGEN